MKKFFIAILLIGLTFTSARASTQGLINEAIGLFEDSLSDDDDNRPKQPQNVARFAKKHIAPHAHKDILHNHRFRRMKQGGGVDMCKRRHNETHYRREFKKKRGG